MAEFAGSSTSARHASSPVFSYAAPLSSCISIGGPDPSPDVSILSWRASGSCEAEYAYVPDHVKGCPSRVPSNLIVSVDS
jgi:hypothetical protein